MAYVENNWVNNTSPALAANNLNKMEKGIAAAVNGEAQNYINTQTESSNEYGSGIEGYVDISEVFSVSGYYINQSGVATATSGAISTPFIRVIPGEEYSITVEEWLAKQYSVCYYDELQTFVSGTHIASATYTRTTTTFTVPSGVSYMRCSSINNTSCNLFKKSNKPVKNVLGDLNEAIGDIYNGYKDISDALISGGTRGKFLKKTGAEDGSASPTSSYFLTDYLPVKEGDVFSYYLYYEYSSNCIYAIYDKEHGFLSSYQGTASTAQTGTVTIPAQAAYIRFCSMNYPSVFKVSKKIIEPILNQIADIKDSLNNFKINTDLHYEMSLTLSSGYLRTNGNVDASDSYRNTDYIDLLNYKWMACYSKYGYAAVAYNIYDESKSVLYSKTHAGGDVYETVKIITSEVLEDYPTAKYIRFSGDTNLKVFVGKFEDDVQFTDAVLSCGNILYKKKIAFCGDSFTAATNLGASNKDYFWNCYKSFAWFIVDRNNMDFYNDGISGSTMHLYDESSPTTRSPFSYQRYKDVPEDCDYIILQFGLNESTIADDPDTLGTVDSTDISTMWGSWNVVLEYLIEHHPTAKIGVIMPDAWMTQSYYEALKDICEWWGIPLLDLGGGDIKLSLNINGRRTGTGYTLNPRAKALRDSTFAQEFDEETQRATDQHPNLEGHRWRSTIIEHWIRSL